MYKIHIMGKYSTNIDYSTLLTDTLEFATEVLVLTRNTSKVKVRQLPAGITNVTITLPVFSSVAISAGVNGSALPREGQLPTAPEDLTEIL